MSFRTTCDAEQMLANQDLVSPTAQPSREPFGKAIGPVRTAHSTAGKELSSPQALQSVGRRPFRNKRIILSEAVARLGDIPNIEGPLDEIGLVRPLEIRWSLSSSCQRGTVCARPDPAGLGVVERGAWGGEREVGSVRRGAWGVKRTPSIGCGQWRVKRKGGSR